jgi:hypothetical protein
MLAVLLALLSSFLPTPPLAFGAPEAPLRESSRADDAERTSRPRGRVVRGISNGF